MNLLTVKSLKSRQSQPVRTRTDPRGHAGADISAELTRMLADLLVLYMKTKNFHWHMSGAHFRDYHLMLAEQADQIFAAVDVMAERARKVGGTTLRSIGHVQRLQRLLDNDAGQLPPQDMLAELADDNRRVASFLRAAHRVCADHGDLASTSLIETWIDEAEHRSWFLAECIRCTA